MLKSHQTNTEFPIFPPSYITWPGLSSLKHKRTHQVDRKTLLSVPRSRKGSYKEWGEWGGGGGQSLPFFPLFLLPGNPATAQVKVGQVPKILTRRAADPRVGANPYCLFFPLCPPPLGPAYRCNHGNKCMAEWAD